VIVVGRSEGGRWGRDKRVKRISDCYPSLNPYKALLTDPGVRLSLSFGTRNSTLTATDQAVVEECFDSMARPAEAEMKPTGQVLLE